MPTVALKECLRARFVGLLAALIQISFFLILLLPLLLLLLLIIIIIITRFMGHFAMSCTI